MISKRCKGCAISARTITKRAITSVFIFLLMLCAHVDVPARSGVVSIEVDLDGDGQRESIRLSQDGADPSLSVSRGRRVLWKGVPARWKPWKLAVADVDGDGRKEIIVGVYKSTRFFPKPHNCLFIYGWDGRRAHPKWLGSSLSKPFLDFAFFDSDRDGQDELLAVERKRDGRLCLALYSWNGFGFTLDRERGEWRELRLIEVTANGIIIEADGERLSLSHSEMRNES